LTFLRAQLGWLIALAVLLTTGAGYWTYRDYQAAQARAQAEGATLRTAVVSRGDIRYLVLATGAILPRQQSNLFFHGPGMVEEVLVKSGDRVRQGQVLARLEATALEQAVRQAEAALAIARLNRQKLLAGPTPGDIAVAEANLRSARAALADLRKGASPSEVNIAQIQYDSLLANYQEAANQYNTAIEAPASAPSQERLDQLKLSMEGAYYAAEAARLQLEVVKRGPDQATLWVAAAQVAQAQATLDQLRAPPTDLQIQQADLAVAQAQLALDQARLQAARAELLAPFDGVVADVNVKAGEPAGRTSPAIVLIDPGQFHLDVAVDEIDVVQLAPGQGVSVTVDALPGSVLSGKVERIAPAAVSTNTGVSYLVRVLLDATPAGLRSNMSATAEIVAAEAKDVLRVPNWAIRRDRRTGQAYASLQVGDQLVETPIETGLRGESYTEVKSGVQAGDVAAVNTAPEQINLLGGGN